MIDRREIKDGYTNCKISFSALRNEEVDIHLGHFENSTISGPINFFVKAVEKRRGGFINKTSKEISKLYKCILK